MVGDRIKQEKMIQLNLACHPEPINIQHLVCLWISPDTLLNINIQAGIELTYVLKYFDDEKETTDFLQCVPSEAHLKYDFDHVHCSPLVLDQKYLKIRI